MWAGILLSLAHVPTGSGLTTATESYEELLKAVKSGSFSLDGKGKDDAKAVLQQILDKSKSTKHAVLGVKSPVSLAQHTRSKWLIKLKNRLKNRLIILFYIIL